METERAEDHACMNKEGLPKVACFKTCEKEKTSSQYDYIKTLRGVLAFVTSCAPRRACEFTQPRKSLKSEE